MRKHFLILMLMALLPLGAFAEQITPSMFVVSDVTYTDEPQVTLAGGDNLPATITVDKDAQDNVIYYKLTGGNYVATTADDLSLAGYLNVGTYYVKITGSNPYSGTVYKPFIVSPKVIEIKFTGTEKDFNGQTPDDATLYAYTWSANKAPENLDEAAENFLTGFKYGTNGTEEDVLRDGDDNVIAYPITATCSDGNYTLTYATTSGGFKINPIDLPATDVANAYKFNGTGTWTYNGAAQTGLPTITVKDGTATLSVGNDYYLVWYSEQALTNVVAAPTNHGNYYAQVVGKGNYKNERSLATWTFEIGKRTAMAYVQPMSKTYDGEQIEMEGAGNQIKGAQLVFNNLATADNTDAFKAKFAAHFKDAGYNAGTVYTDQTAAEYNATLPNHATEGDVKEYVQTEDVAIDANKTYYTENQGEYTAVENPQVADIATYYEKVLYTAQTAAEYNATLPGAVHAGNIASIASPTDAGSYMMKAFATDGSAEANYSFNYMEVGSYTINKRNVTVTAKKQTFAYDGTVKALTTEPSAETVTIEAFNATAGTGLVDGDKIYDTTDENYVALFAIALKEGVVIKETVNAAYTGAVLIQANANPTNKNYTLVPVAGDVEVTGKAMSVIASTFSKQFGYVLNDADLSYLTTETNVSLTKTPTYIVKNAQNVTVTAETGILPLGTYTITIVPDATLAPANYTIANDAYYAGELTITEKELTVVVADQTLSKDATQDALLQGNDYVTITGLVDGYDNIEFTIKGTANFNTAAESPAGIADAITATLDAADEDNDNANYIFKTITTGKLYVVGANTVVLYRVKKDDQPNAAVNTAAALIEQNNGLNPATVKILYNDDTDYNTFKKNQWYAMVLPFDTDVQKISAAFGYAVVDVIRKTNSETNRMYFDLKMDDEVIPANTPFIIKTWKNIDMKNNGVTFSGVKIKMPAAGTTEAPNGNLIAADGAGNQFIGTYEGIIGFGGKGSKDYWFSLDNGEYKQPSATAYLRQMSAYIKVATTSGAHEVIIEELGGQTTVIRNINSADAQVFSGEGWYTLNGVKLQGVPTEKGVYIQNGKKVVIK